MTTVSSRGDCMNDSMRMVVQVLWSLSYQESEIESWRAVTVKDAVMQDKLRKIDCRVRELHDKSNIPGLGVWLYAGGYRASGDAGTDLP